MNYKLFIKNIYVRIKRDLSLLLCCQYPIRKDESKVSLQNETIIYGWNTDSVSSSERNRKIHFQSRSHSEGRARSHPLLNHSPPSYWQRSEIHSRSHQNCSILTCSSIGLNDGCSLIQMPWLWSLLLTKSWPGLKRKDYSENTNR